MQENITYQESSVYPSLKHKPFIPFYWPIHPSQEQKKTRTEFGVSSPPNPKKAGAALYFHEQYHGDLLARSKR